MFAFSVIISAISVLVAFAEVIDKTNIGVCSKTDLE